MARPERNTVDYFPHILGDGKKMFFIETKYGNDGYATWYKILEKLGSTEHHYLNLNREDELMFLSSKCKVSEEVLLNIINDLSKMDIFDKELWANKILWCQTFVDSIEDAYKKRNNNCINLLGLRILLEGLGILKLPKSKSKGSVKPQRKEEDSKVEYTKENKRVFCSDEFVDVFNLWMNYKKKRKETYKSLDSEEAFYDKLLKFSNKDPIKALEIIKNSMSNNWAGIFEPKENNQNATITNNTTKRESVDDKRAKVFSLAQKSFERLENLSNKDGTTGNCI